MVLDFISWEVSSVFVRLTFYDKNKMPTNIGLIALIAIMCLHLFKFRKNLRLINQLKKMSNK